MSPRDMLDGTDGFAWEWRTLGDVLANYTLPAGTTFDEACGWAEAFIRDHPGTAVKMHQEKDTSVQVTVYEVLRLVA